MVHEFVDDSTFLGEDEWNYLFLFAIEKQHKKLGEVACKHRVHWVFLSLNKFEEILQEHVLVWFFNYLRFSLGLCWFVSNILGFFIEGLCLLLSLFNLLVFSLLLKLFFDLVLDIFFDQFFRLFLSLCLFSLIDLFGYGRLLLFLLGLNVQRFRRVYRIWLGCRLL